MTLGRTPMVIQSKTGLPALLGRKCLPIDRLKKKSSSVNYVTYASAEAAQN
jgi:hypothetical protein